VDPPPYSEEVFVDDYRDPFYDTHLLYQIVGLFREDPFQVIEKTMRTLMGQLIQWTSDKNNTRAIGSLMFFMVANEVFGDEESRNKYDDSGDPEISRVSSTIKNKDPTFYQNHTLYEVAGAQKNDDIKKITVGLKKAVYRILQDMRDEDTYNVRRYHGFNLHAAKHFKVLWYNACYFLTDPYRREQYDAGNDNDTKFKIPRGPLIWY